MLVTHRMDEVEQLCDRIFIAKRWLSGAVRQNRRC